MSTPVAGPLATVPLHVAAGDIAVWWNDTGATWESVPLGSGPAGPQGVPGPAGPTGATGAQGPAGAANMTGMVAGQIPIAATATSVTSSTATLTASFMPAYTGDVTSPAGSTVNTLPVVNSNVGTFQGITVDAKGLVTAAANQDYATTASLGTMSTQNATAVAITGGAVNGTPIGAATPSTGTFSAVSTDASAGNGYTFYDRTVVSTGWQMRASAGLMSFFNNVASASVLTLSNAGNLTVAGSLAVANNANPTLAVSGGSTLVNAPAGSASGNITVANTFTVSYATTLYVNNAAGSSTFAYFDSGGSHNVSGSWLVISAAELKQDVAPYSRGLDAVLALNPVTYRYRAGTTFAAGDVPSEPQVGLIAEEVQPHIPEMVGETTLKLGQEDRVVATLSPTDLVYVLVNAVKELSARVASLEARLV